MACYWVDAMDVRTAAVKAGMTDLITAEQMDEKKADATD